MQFQIPSMAGAQVVPGTKIPWEPAWVSIRVSMWLSMWGRTGEVGVAVARVVKRRRRVVVVIKRAGRRGER